MSVVRQRPNQHIAMLIFCLEVGINTTLPVFLVPNYGFGPTQIGLFYLTPVVATLLGVAAGHYLNQAIQDISLRRRKGVWHPEDRLFMNWIALPFMITGMIILGFALERQFHYMCVRHRSAILPLISFIGWSA